MDGTGYGGIFKQLLPFMATDRFSYAAPFLWNSLPVHFIRQANSLQ